MASPLEQEEKMLHQRLAEIRAGKGEAIGGLGIGIPVDQCNMQAATPQHPRDVLLSDFNDQEQRLLDKITAVRQIKEELNFMGRDEAKRLVKLLDLARRLV